MKKFWLVCWNEYRRHVLRKRFIFVILSMPFFVLVIGLVGLLAVGLEYNPRPVGYVDLSGRFAHAAAVQENGRSFLVPALEMRPFADEATALTALQRNQIQVYYVISADYLDTGKVMLVANKPPSDSVGTQFEKFLRSNLLAGQPDAVVHRLIDGTSVTLLSGESSQAQNEWVKLLVPIISGVLFVIVINTSGGYLLQAVVEEKENRTMEIVITSVSTTQLMAGKVVGNLSVGLTQLLVWLAFPLGWFLVVRNNLPFLQNLNFQPQFFWLMFAILLPAFVMVSALMATIGATATESREAQQVAGLFTLPISAPYWFIGAILSSPNSLLSRGLSYFPLTAPVTLLTRASFTTLPGWEIAMNLGILYLFAGLAVWMSGRAFRLGLLRYGKPLSWRELFSTGSSQ